MKLVRLHGALREFELLYAPDGFWLNVETPVHAARLLAAQIPAFDKALGSGNFRVRIGSGKRSKDVNADYIAQRLGRHSEIHITPAGQGAISRDSKKVITGVAILGIALTGGAALGPTLGAGLAATGPLGLSFGSLALAGASTILTGAASMLAGDANIGRYENRESPEDRPNFVLSGAVNTLNEGGAVQWIYGKRVRVGSTVLSAGIFDEQIGPGLPVPEADGLIARFTGSATGTVGN